MRDATPGPWALSDAERAEMAGMLARLRVELRRRPPDSNPDKALARLACWAADRGEVEIGGIAAYTRLILAAGERDWLLAALHKMAAELTPEHETN